MVLIEGKGRAFEVSVICCTQGLRGDHVIDGERSGSKNMNTQILQDLGSLLDAGVPSVVGEIASEGKARGRYLILCKIYISSYKHSKPRNDTTACMHQ